ncbi:MAG: hypothetical protein KJZ59_05520 [Pararhodobacter sp.]|nr:hypothetical protein [Pararhodobacter sp.]
MASADYLRRMEIVLSARAEDKAAKENPPMRRLARVAGVLAGTLALFFVLKAAALAYSEQPFAAAPAAEAGLGAQIHHWIAGADPISKTLALALRPDPTRPTGQGSTAD